MFNVIKICLYCHMFKAWFVAFLVCNDDILQEICVK